MIQSCAVGYGLGQAETQILDSYLTLHPFAALRLSHFIPFYNRVNLYTMDIITSFKKQKVLHLTTVTDSELLGIGGVASRPTPHPIVPFRQDQEEGACIMQLDLMKTAYMASNESETESQEQETIMDVSSSNATSTLETSEKREEQELTSRKRRVFELMQKSYTELSQLLTLTQSLHNEKYMTLLTCTRSGGLQPVGSDLPAMQRVAIVKSNLHSLIKPLQVSADAILQLSKQRQTFTNQLLLLKRKWKLSTALGYRGRHSLTGRDVLTIDCGLGIKNAGVLSMLGACIVPLVMGEAGSICLPTLEKARPCNTLYAEICTPQGVTLISCNSWDICKLNLLPLGVPELEDVHEHCQQKQQEMLDTALMVCIRTDASTRAERWILAPPISAPAAVTSHQIEQTLKEYAKGLPVSDNLKFDVQVVHRAEVIVRLTDSLLLRFQLKPVADPSAQSPPSLPPPPQQQHDKNRKEEKHGILQSKALHMLSSAVLGMHSQLLRSFVHREKGGAHSTASGTDSAGTVAGAAAGEEAGAVAGAPMVLPRCIQRFCTAFRTLT